jgi:cephalosporin hydroxylase
VSGEVHTTPEAGEPDEADQTEVPVQAEVERVAREFTQVFHGLRKQTFSTTTWLGVPLVKTPNDMIVLQQILTETRPELVIETGVYLGGSALMFASLMDLLGIDGEVIAVDIDLAAVRPKVTEHPRIELIEGSSVAPEVVSRIRSAAQGKRTMLDLDSDHRAHHVLEELRTYTPLVTPGCYAIVEDSFLGGRPVRPEAVPGPSEALDAWFGEDPPFVPDRWHERYLLTQNPRGYLRRVDQDAPEPRPARPQHFVTGALELTGVNGEFETPAPEDAMERLTAAAGEPDLEVEELRRSLTNAVTRDAQTHIEADLDRRRQELTVESLLREIEGQRELLAERNRMLSREQNRLRRFTESFPYRSYRKLRAIPGLAKFFSWRDRSRLQDAQKRSRHRAENRERQTERFSGHHRGQ